MTRNTASCSRDKVRDDPLPARTGQHSATTHRSRREQNMGPEQTHRKPQGTQNTDNHQDVWLKVPIGARHHPIPSRGFVNSGGHSSRCAVNRAKASFTATTPVDVQHTHQKPFKLMSCEEEVRTTNLSNQGGIQETLTVVCPHTNAINFTRNRIPHNKLCTFLIETLLSNLSGVPCPQTVRATNLLKTWWTLSFSVNTPGTGGG